MDSLHLVLFPGTTATRREVIASLPTKCFDRTKPSNLPKSTTSYQPARNFPGNSCSLTCQEPKPGTLLKEFFLYFSFYSNTTIYYNYTIKNCGFFRHEYVTITPDGYRFRKNNFETVGSLIKWFKEHFRDPIPGTPITTPGGGGSGRLTR